MNFSKEKKVSEYFYEHEVYFSGTAQRLGIDNKAKDPKHIKNIEKTLAIADQIRSNYLKPIKVTSFYRSQELNKAIGGSLSSQHLVGEAMDIQDFQDAINNRDLFELILNNFDFHQLILEFPNEFGIPKWVHVGFKHESKQEKRISVAKKVNGKTVYEHFNLRDEFYRKYPYNEKLKQKAVKSRTKKKIIPISVFGFAVFLIILAVRKKM